jgi:hypothetical protein
MENRYLELEPITPPPESTDDSNKTLQIIEELGRDLDALEDSAPRRFGLFKFVRRQFSRSVKN